MHETSQVSKHGSPGSFRRSVLSSAGDICVRKSSACEDLYKLCVSVEQVTSNQILLNTQFKMYTWMVILKQNTFSAIAQAEISKDLKFAVFALQASFIHTRLREP